MMYPKLGEAYRLRELFMDVFTGSVTFSVSLVYCFISLITNLFLFFNFT
jgi:hypothetical protein